MYIASRFNTKFIRMKHKDISIENSYKLEIINFAEKCYRTNKAEYKRRGQEDAQKIKQDIYYGKVAEYAVWLMYKEMGQNCTKPDVGVYKTSQKSYDRDMTVNDTHHLHVKSQLLKQAQSFGLSWIFQKNDPLVTRPIPQDYVVLTLIMNNNLVRVYQPQKAKDLIGVYGKPKKRALQSTKVTLYGKDIGIEF